MRFYSTNFHRLTKYEYGALAAIDASSRSEDPQTQTGCALFGADWKPLGTGCNGFKPGFVPSPDLFEDRAKKSSLITHAEKNAIKNANQKQSIHYLFSVLSPCIMCATMIKDWDIKEVLYIQQYTNGATNIPDEAFKGLFDTCGVIHRQITPEELMNIGVFVTSHTAKIIGDGTK